MSPTASPPSGLPGVSPASHTASSARSASSADSPASSALPASSGSSTKRRVVIVTGGGTGIGAAIAQEFREAEDATVIVMGRRPGPLQEVASRTGAEAVVADASDTPQLRQAVRGILDRHGHIDVAVANAGTGEGVASVLNTTDEGWETTISGNLNTAFKLARETLPALIESKGNIVIVSSLGGLFAAPACVSYTTTKHALSGLTKSLANDYGPLGVRTNTICPAFVRTEMSEGEMDKLIAAGKASSYEEGYAIGAKDIPLRRIAEAREMATVVHFLSSDRASYVNGAIIPVDGGSHVVDVPTLAFA